MKLEIEYVDINSIKHYEKNAKLHPQEQIEQIKMNKKIKAIKKINYQI